MEPRPDPRSGFTLIELLVIVLILGLLAALAVPRFTKPREKAFDGAAKTDLRNAMAAQEAYFAAYDAYGPMSALAFTTSAGVRIGGGGSAAGYFLSARHTSSPNTWHVHPGSGDADAERIHAE